MRLSFIPLLLACLLAGTTTEAATGLWRTIDDSSGEGRSLVAIDDRDGVLVGHIVDLIDPAEPHPAEPPPLCEQCPGEKQGMPVEGLEILWGFESSGRSGEWLGGELLDPENGRVYSGRLRLKDDGDRLEVRGFIGSVLFGRSQIWERVEAR